ncbi:MAG TPA: fluoride efflux transporter CrcB [Phormidium sp.]
MLQDPSFRAPIAISLGAIAGSLTRYYLTLYFTQSFGSSFPVGTFLINLTGCFGMGFFVTLVERGMNLSPELRLLVTTGFLGAYTTFSTYGLDTINLWRTGNYLATAFYWSGSAILGILSLQIGVILAKLL